MPFSPTALCARAVRYGPRRVVETVVTNPELAQSYIDHPKTSRGSSRPLPLGGGSVAGCSLAPGTASREAHMLAWQWYGRGAAVPGAPGAPGATGSVGESGVWKDEGRAGGPGAGGAG